MVSKLRIIWKQTVAGGHTPARLFVACEDTSRMAKGLLRFDRIICFDLNHAGSNRAYVGSLVHPAWSAPYWKGTIHHELFGLCWREGVLLAVSDAYPGPDYCAIKTGGGNWEGECGEVVVWGAASRFTHGAAVGPLYRLSLGLRVRGHIIGHARNNM